MTRAGSEDATDYAAALSDPAHPEHQDAVDTHTELIKTLVGPDPVGAGDPEWPDGLNLQTLPGQSAPVWDIPASEPLRGWRFWSVKRGRLAAPWEADPRVRRGRVTGRLWQPGANLSNQDYCSELDPNSTVQHPLGHCGCGIRVMQSLEVLTSYVGAQYLSAAAGFNDVIRVHAVAEVTMWGRVSRGEPLPGDWPWTARAQYVELSGPIYLSPSREPQRRKLESFYGAPSPIKDLDWPWW